jgi:predicted MFS family arabinose efflux permease
VARERRAPEPILPLRLFRNPVFDVVSATLFLTTLAFFAVIVFMPVYLQVVAGVSATDSGLLLLPLLFAATTSTALSGRVISRTGRYKVFPVTGLALMTAGLLLLAQIGTGTAQATVALLLVVFGAGFGMVSQVLMVAIQNAVDRSDLGIATASANLFRSLGGSVGVAVFGAIFAGRIDGTVRTSPDAVAHALTTVFLAAAPVAALGALVVLTLKEVPLRTAAS